MSQAGGVDPIERELIDALKDMIRDLRNDKTILIARVAQLELQLQDRHDARIVTPMLEKNTRPAIAPPQPVMPVILGHDVETGDAESEAAAAATENSEAIRAREEFEANLDALEKDIRSDPGTTPKAAAYLFATGDHTDQSEVLEDEKTPVAVSPDAHLGAVERADG